MLKSVFLAHASTRVHTCIYTRTWPALGLPALLFAHPGSSPAPSLRTTLSPCCGCSPPRMAARSRSHLGQGLGTWAAPAWWSGPSWLAQASGKQLLRQPEPSLPCQALGSQAEAWLQGPVAKTGGQGVGVLWLHPGGPGDWREGDRAWDSGL